MEEKLKNYVCEKCGGELKDMGEGRYLCPYCRTEFFKETTLPDELVLDLHSANRERSLQRFEDALNEYDRIISSYPDCFDAYWGATLSDYGIQYEKDYDGRMIPTVHRYSEVPVFENSYYQNAEKYCKNENEKERIEKSATEIEKIRAEIKKTVGTQQPYDIFLCYKESPADGKTLYTPEFKWASNLYIDLTSLGYRVFFAKESLPASKGDYEAHIFPALKSAKLMLILTSSIEHVNSVWVKNEWSRFLRFSKENPSEGKRFKVIYSGIKPEMLPRELNKEQGLDHDSNKWYESLLAVVSDTFRDKKKEEEERKKREEEAQAARLEKMLEQALKKRESEESTHRQEITPSPENDEVSDAQTASPSPSVTDGGKKKKAVIHSFEGVKLNDIIKFGSYRQKRGENDTEIEWQVLDVVNGKAFVISKYALDCKSYNETKGKITWETCTLRTWLNSEFLSSAFADEEKARILTVTVAADKNHFYNSNSGNDTEDKIFLLSEREADKYFDSSKKRECRPTEQAIFNGAYFYKNSKTAAWWLRTAGTNTKTAVTVYSLGTVMCAGKEVESKEIAVRPAMWIDIEGSYSNTAYIEKQLTDGFYKGYAVNGIPNGRGVMQYTSGDVYEGDFIGGEKFGTGKITFANGDVYEGPFISNKQHGKGKITTPAGDVYEGGFLGDKKHGNGRITYARGGIFEGEWEYGEGKGRLTLNGKTLKGKMDIQGNFKKTLF